MFYKDLEIELFLNGNNIHVLCITEHWLRNSEAIFNFNNHQVTNMFNRYKIIVGNWWLFNSFEKML